MPNTYNIYCDESCHLENDKQKAMVLGAVWCAADKVKEIAVRIREIKQKHSLKPSFEIKWTKISAAKVDFYLDLVDYFFDDDDINFRALIVPEKDKLNHQKFNSQTHDVWYYKMYFDLLKVLLSPQERYRIYIDIKDTNSSEKVFQLHEVLSNNLYDFSRTIVEKVQQIRSHESELLQLADLLIGAVSYVSRDLDTSVGKVEVVERIKKRSGYSLTRSTLLKEEKFNIFKWRASEL